MKQIKKILKNSHAKTSNLGRKVGYPELEDELAQWFERMQLDDIPVCTKYISNRRE